MQGTSLALLLLFVFLVFFVIGLLTTSGNPRHIPLLLFWAMVTTYGAFAVIYAGVSLRFNWLLIFAIMPIEWLVFWWFNKRLELQPVLPSIAHSELANRLGWSIGLACLLIVVSYTLVWMVLQREAKRFFRVNAEVELASEIHRALVPRIDMRIGAFEIYGLSVPSGEVGGDLVDALVRPQRGSWIAYLADVSGHGVSSGVLMAMLKSATRMSLRQNVDAPRMLDEVNEVFYALKAPSSFATFAAISCTEQEGLEVIVAGHLPVLCCNGREVRELDTPGLPLGILPESQFCALSLDVGVGDILAIFTDGLTEVFNKKEVELEDGYIRRTLVEEYHRPLEQLASRLIAQANAWGPATDDQSLLLVRRTG